MTGTYSGPGPMSGEEQSDRFDGGGPSKLGAAVGLSSSGNEGTGPRLVRGTFYVFSPERAYMAVAVTCLVGVMVILPLARPPTAGAPVAIALGLDALICLNLAASHRLPDSERIHLARAIAVFFVGLLAGVPGWFFGTFSGFLALAALAVMLAGIVSGSAQVRRPTLPGWATYAGVATGQALAFILPFTHIVGDRSLVPLFFYYKEPRSNHVVSHLATQVILLVAFLGARAFQREYQRLAAEVDAAGRGAAVRSALLAEARADYMRALLVGRRAADAAPRGAGARAPLADPGSTVVEQATTLLGQSRDSGDDADTVIAHAGEAPAVHAALAGAPGAGAVASEEAAELRWDDAYSAKMRRQHRGVTVLAVFGCIVVASIAHHRAQIYVAWASIAAVVATSWFQRRLARVRRSERVYWPWAIIAALSVGPAYAFGLHSSFVAVIVVLLFLGGLFRAKQRVSGPDRRIVVLAALCFAQAGAFALVFGGVIPDIGNVPVSGEGAAPFEPIVQQLLLQGVYVSAFVAGWLVDRRYEELMRRAADAAREDVRQEEILATTRFAIDRLQEEDGEGIFANHRVGRFALRRLCARGGMGDVYEATEDGTGRRVAVKLVRYDRAADPVMLGMFVTEAAALGQVRSPHVAEVLDTGGLEQELPYVAMEFIDGPPLSKVLRERRQLPLRELAALARDASAGLAAIHLAGIVHRDVKPQNIMRSSTDVLAPWKLVDLGVAQPQDGTSWMTTELVIGTPQYMAPEQVLGGSVDARADLYSLCVVLYRALTGRPVFVTRDHAVARGIGHGLPPNPRRFVAVPRDVEYVLRIGLAARPEDRFGSAQELASAFDAALASALGEDCRYRARLLLAREPWTEP